MAKILHSKFAQISTPAFAALLIVLLMFQNCSQPLAIKRNLPASTVTFNKTIQISAMSGLGDITQGVLPGTTFFIYISVLHNVGNYSTKWEVNGIESTQFADLENASFAFSFDGVESYSIKATVTDSKTKATDSKTLIITKIPEPTGPEDGPIFFGESQFQQTTVANLDINASPDPSIIYRDFQIGFVSDVHIADEIDTKITWSVTHYEDDGRALSDENSLSGLLETNTETVAQAAGFYDLAAENVHAGVYKVTIRVDDTQSDLSAKLDYIFRVIRPSEGTMMKYMDVGINSDTQFILRYDAADTSHAQALMEFAHSYGSPAVKYSYLLGKGVRPNEFSQVVQRMGQYVKGANGDLIKAPCCDGTDDDTLLDSTNIISIDPSNTFIDNSEGDFTSSSSVKYFGMFFTQDQSGNGIRTMKEFEVTVYKAGTGLLVLTGADPVNASAVVGGAPRLVTFFLKNEGDVPLIDLDATSSIVGTGAAQFAFSGGVFPGTNPGTPTFPACPVGGTALAVGAVCEINIMYTSGVDSADVHEAQLSIDYSYVEEISGDSFSNNLIVDIEGHSSEASSTWSWEETALTCSNLFCGASYYVPSQVKCVSSKVTENPSYDSTVSGVLNGASAAIRASVLDGSEPTGFCNGADLNLDMASSLCEPILEQCPDYEWKLSAGSGVANECEMNLVIPDGENFSDVYNPGAAITCSKTLDHTCKHKIDIDSNGDPVFEDGVDEDCTVLSVYQTEYPNGVPVGKPTVEESICSEGPSCDYYVWKENPDADPDLTDTILFNGFFENQYNNSSVCLANVANGCYFRGGEIKVNDINFCGALGWPVDQLTSYSRAVGLENCRNLPEIEDLEKVLAVSIPNITDNVELSYGSVRVNGGLDINIDLKKLDDMETYGLSNRFKHKNFVYEVLVFHAGTVPTSNVVNGEFDRNEAISAESFGPFPTEITDTESPYKETVKALDSGAYHVLLHDAKKGAGTGTPVSFVADQDNVEVVLVVSNPASVYDEATGRYEQSVVLNTFKLVEQGNGGNVQPSEYPDFIHDNVTLTSGIQVELRSGELADLEALSGINFAITVIKLGSGGTESFLPFKEVGRHYPMGVAQATLRQADDGSGRAGYNIPLSATHAQVGDELQLEIGITGYDNPVRTSSFFVEALSAPPAGAGSASSLGFANPVKNEVLQVGDSSIQLKLAADEFDSEAGKLEFDILVTNSAGTMSSALLAQVAQNFIDGFNVDLSAVSDTTTYSVIAADVLTVKVSVRFTGGTAVQQEYSYTLAVTPEAEVFLNGEAAGTGTNIINGQFTDDGHLNLYLATADQQANSTYLVEVLVYGADDENGDPTVLGSVSYVFSDAELARLSSADGLDLNLSSMSEFPQGSEFLVKLTATEKVALSDVGILNLVADADSKIRVKIPNILAVPAGKRFEAYIVAETSNSNTVTLRVPLDSAQAVKEESSAGAGDGGMLLDLSSYGVLASAKVTAVTRPMLRFAQDDDVIAPAVHIVKTQEGKRTYEQTFAAALLAENNNLVVAFTGNDAAGEAISLEFPVYREELNIDEDDIGTMSFDLSVFNLTNTSSLDVHLMKTVTSTSDLDEPEVLQALQFLSYTEGAASTVVTSGPSSSSNYVATIGGVDASGSFITQEILLGAGGSSVTKDLNLAPYGFVDGALSVVVSEVPVPFVTMISQAGQITEAYEQGDLAEIGQNLAGFFEFSPSDSDFSIDVEGRLNTLVVQLEAGEFDSSPNKTLEFNVEVKFLNGSTVSGELNVPHANSSFLFGRSQSVLSSAELMEATASFVRVVIPDTVNAQVGDMVQVIFTVTDSTGKVSTYNDFNIALKSVQVVESVIVEPSDTDPKHLRTPILIGFRHYEDVHGAQRLYSVMAIEEYADAEQIEFRAVGFDSDGALLNQYTGLAAGMVEEYVNAEPTGIYHTNNLTISSTNVVDSGLNRSFNSAKYSNHPSDSDVIDELDFDASISSSKKLQAFELEVKFKGISNTLSSNGCNGNYYGGLSYSGSRLSGIVYNWTGEANAELVINCMFMASDVRNLAAIRGAEVEPAEADRTISNIKLVNLADQSMATLEAVVAIDAKDDFVFTLTEKAALVEDDKVLIENGLIVFDPISISNISGTDVLSPACGKAHEGSFYLPGGQTPAEGLFFGAESEAKKTTVGIKQENANRFSLCENGAAQTISYNVDSEDNHTGFSWNCSNPAVTVECEDALAQPHRNASLIAGACGDRYLSCEATYNTAICGKKSSQQGHRAPFVQMPDATDSNNALEYCGPGSVLKEASYYPIFESKAFCDTDLTPPDGADNTKTCEEQVSEYYKTVGKTFDSERVESTVCASGNVVDPVSSLPVNDGCFVGEVKTGTHNWVCQLEGFPTEETACTGNYYDANDPALQCKGLAQVGVRENMEIVTLITETNVAGNRTIPSQWECYVDMYSSDLGEMVRAQGFPVRNEDPDSQAYQSTEAYNRSLKTYLENNSNNELMEFATDFSADILGHIENVTNVYGTFYCDLKKKVRRGGVFSIVGSGDSGSAMLDDCRDEHKGLRPVYVEQYVKDKPEHPFVPKTPNKICADEVPGSSEAARDRIWYYEIEQACKEIPFFQNKDDLAVVVDYAEVLFPRVNHLLESWENHGTFDSHKRYYWRSQYQSRMNCALQENHESFQLYPYPVMNGTSLVKRAIDPETGDYIDETTQPYYFEGYPADPLNDGRWTDSKGVEQPYDWSMYTNAGMSGDDIAKYRWLLGVKATSRSNTVGDYIDRYRQSISSHGTLGSVKRVYPKLRSQRGNWAQRVDSTNVCDESGCYYESIPATITKSAKPLDPVNQFLLKNSCRLTGGR
ncbi:MAG: hypothetical protein HOO06_10525 [Bdellovibrionaceae bacterium]|nr:hypothetical protein [Pseudobdellovibrionaceae bacterium]